MYSIDAARMWNLGEMGMTANNDAKRKTSLKLCMRRRSARTMRVPEFVRTNRETFMPVVSAKGKPGPLLLVFKGKRLPSRGVIVDGPVQGQIYTTFLSRDIILVMT